MRAAIYTRISRDRVGAGLGVDRQEEDCRALAARLGWDVVAVFEDNDLSAYSGKHRPGYVALCDLLRAGGAEAVLAWHTDRLHRRSADLDPFIDLCTSHRITVQTVHAGVLDLSTASGQMTARIVSAVAQHEIDHSRERIVRAKAQAAQAGQWRGGRRPFGYEADGVTLRQGEADALAEASIKILAGRSLLAVAREMNAAGVVTTGGHPIDGTSLRRLLLRARNAGLIEVGGRIVGQAEWPAIIDEDTWRGVVSALTDPSRRTTPGPERRWLLSGIAVCGTCKARLRSHSSPGRKFSYRCPEGAHVARDAHAVDAYVRLAIETRLSRPDAATLLAVEAEDAGPLRAEARALRARLAGFEADYAEGLITARVLRSSSATVEAALEAVEARIGALTAHRAGAGVIGAPDPAEAFVSAPLDVQRDVIDALASVTIHQGRKGRPAGWRPGQPYVDLSTVEVTWSAAPGERPAAGA